MITKQFIYFISISSILLLTNVFAQSQCNTKKSIATSGGYRNIQIANNKLVDVESFIETDGMFFYATSPIYGKPEVGVVNCNTQRQFQLVKPQVKSKSYPDGSDFFRIKDVTKNKDGTYTVRYYYAPNVDKEDFKNFNREKNLRSVKFSN